LTITSSPSPSSAATTSPATSPINSSTRNNTSEKPLKITNEMTMNEEWYLIPDDEHEPNIVKIVNRAHNVALECPPVGKLTAREMIYAQGDHNSDSFLWNMEYDDGNTSNVRLRSIATNFYLSYAITNSGSFVSCSATDEANDSAETLWRLEYCTGELCYVHHQPTLVSSLQRSMTSDSNNDNSSSSNSRLLPKKKPLRLLMCDNMGFLRLTTKFGGWEVWRFLHADNDNTVRISSWTHEDYFLTCDSQGRVILTEDRWHEDTLWKIERASLEGVSIQSIKTKRYLTIQDSSGTVCALTAFPGNLGIFQFTAAHRQQYFLSSYGQDKRLSLVRTNSVKLSKHRRDCEIWELEALDHGFVMLRSKRWGKFLKCHNHKLGVSDDPQDEDVLQACIWKMIPSPVCIGTDGGGGICIVSAMEHGLAISCNSETGELQLVPENESLAACWNLEPCMPHSLQQWQINLIVGGLVGAAVLPVVAMGAAAAGSAAMAGGAASGAAAAGGTTAAGTAAAATAIAAEVSVH